MPTVTVPSVSIRTHSCESRYFSSIGILLMMSSLIHLFQNLCVNVPKRNVRHKRSFVSLVKTVKNRTFLRSLHGRINGAFDKGYEWTLSSKYVGQIAFPLRTNGYFTMHAFNCLPRMSTFTSPSAATGTRANAMDFSKVGEK